MSSTASFSASTYPYSPKSPSYSVPTSPMSASSSSSSSSSSLETPTGFDDFLSRMRHELSLSSSQMEKLAQAYTESLQKSYVESHCQHASKSKTKPTCGRELVKGECTIHKSDIHAPPPKPVTPKCCFPTAKGPCGRGMPDGKSVCGFHEGQTPMHDKTNCCSFIFQAGIRKGKECGAFFSDYKVPGENSVEEYVPEEYMEKYCPTHYLSMIMKMGKSKSSEEKKEEKKSKSSDEDAEEKPKKKKSKSSDEDAEEKPKKKKSKVSDEDQKQEAQPEEEDEIDIEEDGDENEYPNLKFKFPKEDVTIVSVPIIVDGDKDSYLRAKLKLNDGSAMLTPIVYKREAIMKSKRYEIVGYTADLTNNTVSAVVEKHHPVIDEFVAKIKSKFPNSVISMMF